MPLPTRLPLPPLARVRVQAARGAAAGPRLTGGGANELATLRVSSAGGMCTGVETGVLEPRRDGNTLFVEEENGYRKLELMVSYSDS